ncbi:MAG: hypothetical protein MNSN_03580 [Minisyncoccus archaeiphilus]|uniref:LamG domain-containing protein n=1 Tax=Minisyncoccus archaeiphilus TaxID=3238481 RepID=UPI002B11F70A|nr:MAG: hypothetical protein MNSN_03580 [Candidatus Parcubacteria bacterium]
MRNIVWTDIAIAFFIIAIVIITINFALDSAHENLSDSQKKAYVNQLSRILNDYRKENPSTRLPIHTEGCVIRNGMNYCGFGDLFNEMPHDPNEHDYFYRSSDGIDFTLRAVLSTSHYYIYDSTISDSVVIKPQYIIDGVCGKDNTKALFASPSNLCVSGTPSKVTASDKVVLLMHMDGDDGKRVFRDQTKKLFMVNGDVVTSTRDKMFGSASALFDGGSYLSIASSDDFNFESSDFTIDFWIYLTDLKGEQVFISRGDNDFKDTPHLMIRKNESNMLDAFVRSESESILGRIQGGEVSEKKWHHVAYVRKGNIFYLFLDGKKISSVNGEGNYLTSTHPLRIGAHNHDSQSKFLKGYIDEVRIVKGVGEWSDDFILANEQYYWYNWKCEKEKGGISAQCGAENYLK